MIHQRSHASRSNNCHNLLPRIMQCSSPWRHRKNWSRPISYGFLWFFYVLMFWSANFFVTFLYFSHFCWTFLTRRSYLGSCVCVKSLWNLCEIVVFSSPGLWCAKGRLSNLWRVLPRSLQCMSRRRNEGSAILDHQRRDTKSPGSVHWFHWSHGQHFQTRVWYLFDMFHMFDMFVSYCWCVWCMLHLFLHTPCSNTMISMIKSTTTVDAVSITRCADFPAPAVPSTRAHHHPTVILEPKERSSTNNSNRIAIE